MSEIIQYPMAEAWSKVFKDASAILQFMEWLDNNNPEDGEWVSREDLVYEYFEIDPKQLEMERRAMLENLHG